MSLYLGTLPIAVNSSSRNIGEIIQSTIPLTDAGLHLLDGSLISGSGSYSAFVTYIASLVSSYPDLFETEANWQQSVTTYGVCGKFVYDSVNNTVRLPKITGFTEGTIDPTVLGDLTEAGLPNITGTIGNGIEANTNPTATGAFYVTTTSSGGEGNGNYRYFGMGIDASLSNSIYGNSSTVQPQSIKVLYYIVIATSTKTQIEVDIDEIATDLNGKADVDLSNCTKPHIVETYVNGTEWYRVYSDGWCEQGGRISGGNQNVYFLKPYRDTSYSVVAQEGYKGSVNWNGNPITISQTTLTTDYFKVSTYGDYTNITAMWQACGYIS